jgi:hypothetical protein
MAFFLNFFELPLGAMFRSLFPRKTYRNNYRALSDIDKVKYLEKRRQYKGYKKKWLYYRRREEGLLEMYNKLFKPELKKLEKGNYEGEGVDGTKFSFGKCNSKFVEDIWESARGYLEWLSNQEWMAESR